MEKKLLYKGKPVELLTRGDLIEAIYSANRAYVLRGETIERISALRASSNAT